MPVPHLVQTRAAAGILVLLVTSLAAGAGWLLAEDAPVAAAPSDMTAAGNNIQQAAATDEVALRPWKYIVIHHSATTAGSVASIDAEHRTRTDAAGLPWKGIGYHFVIGNGNGMADGEVQPTFRWREQQAGAHAGEAEYNNAGIGICLIGNFEQQPPTPAQLKAARLLVRQLQQTFQISDSQLLRHGDLKATACPGKLFSMEMIIAAGPQSAPATMARIPTGSNP